MNDKLVGIIVATVSIFTSQVAYGQDTNFKMAFIGDQGLGAKPEKVLALIKKEGAQAVLHLGDFDYTNNPTAWEKQINKVFGPDFPYFLDCCVLPLLASM